MSFFQPLNTFQVHITLPDVFTRRFAALIPQQRERVNQLEGRTRDIKLCFGYGTQPALGNHAGKGSRRL
jgi:hypothetical protein